MLASQNGHIETVEWLLNRGVDVDILDNTGRTALILASAHGHVNVVEILLRYEANLKTVDHEGQTALMRGSEKGHTEIVKLLSTDAPCVRIVVASVETDKSRDRGRKWVSYATLFL